MQRVSFQLVDAANDQPFPRVSLGFFVPGLGVCSRVEDNLDIANDDLSVALDNLLIAFDEDANLADQIPVKFFTARPPGDLMPCSWIFANSSSTRLFFTFGDWKA